MYIYSRGNYPTAFLLWRTRFLFPARLWKLFRRRGARTMKVSHSCIQILVAGAQFPKHVIRILVAGGGRTRKIWKKIIKILLAGGTTVQVSTHAVKILLAGGGGVQVSTHAIRILLAGRRTVQISTHAVRIFLSRRQDRPGQHPCRQDTISGREDVGHLVSEVQSY